MRTIERLLQRAKSRPQPELLGTVQPWGDKWYFTLHSTKGRYKRRYDKGEAETEEKAFDFREDAIKYGESVMGGKGKLLAVSFIDMDKKQVPFTTAEKEAAGIAVN